MNFYLEKGEEDPIKFFHRWIEWRESIDNYSCITLDYDEQKGWYLKTGDSRVSCFELLRLPSGWDFSPQSFVFTLDVKFKQCERVYQVFSFCCTSRSLLRVKKNFEESLKMVYGIFQLKQELGIPDTTFSRIWETIEIAKAWVPDWINSSRNKLLLIRNFLLYKIKFPEWSSGFEVLKLIPKKRYYVRLGHYFIDADPNNKLSVRFRLKVQPIGSRKKLFLPVRIQFDSSDPSDLKFLTRLLGPIDTVRSKILKLRLGV